jgi:hypothetical protein
MKNRQPNAARWDQIEGESSRAYLAFKSYRDLETKPRTLLAAYRDFSGKKQATKAASHFFDWKQKFDWESRAIAYDRHLETIKMQADEKALSDERRKWQKRKLQTREESWNLAEDLQKKAKEILALPLYETIKEETETSSDGKTVLKTFIMKPVRGSLANAMNALVNADKLRRLACDMATERIVNESPEAEYRRLLESAREDFAASKMMFPDEADHFRAETIAEAYGVRPKDVYDLYEPLTVPVENIGNEFAN